MGSELTYGLYTDSPSRWTEQRHLTVLCSTDLTVFIQSQHASAEPSVAGSLYYGQQWCLLRMQ